MKSLILKEKEIINDIPGIVIPLVGKSNAELIEEAKAINLVDCDLIEWRLDFYDEVLDLDKVTKTFNEIKRNTNKPLLLTFRTLKEGGQKEITDHDYLKLYETLIDTKQVEIIDVEGSLDKSVIDEITSYAHKNNVKVVNSYHNFESTPSASEIEKTYEYLDSLNGDVLKIALMPTSGEDVVALINATKNYDSKTSKPIISMSMGSIGTLSRIIGEYSKSILTFGSLDKASAPGQINYVELRDLLNKVHQIKDKNIFLIGFMGSGKTTIAKSFKDLLDLEILEMDEEIVKRNKLSINDIFKIKGEDYFRQEETNLLKEFNNKKGYVISCGGGVPMREENISIMKENGTVVLLHATPQTIYQRLKDDHSRPLLEGNKNIDYINELMAKRKDKYLKASDISIDVDNKEVTTIIEEIIRKL